VISLRISSLFYAGRSGERNIFKVSAICQDSRG